MWIEWVEPSGPNNEPVYMRISEATAIAKQKDTAHKVRKYIYESDDKALEDFITLNWATKRSQQWQKT